MSTSGCCSASQDAVTVDGTARDMYDFLNDAQHWQERLPHVNRVVLTENDPGLQILEMDTKTADGSTHTTKSVRICFPHERIVYKQTTLPALMTLHTGSWRIIADPAGREPLTVTSRHVVSINERAITRLLGEEADLPYGRRSYARRSAPTASPPWSTPSGMPRRS